MRRSTFFFGWRIGTLLMVIMIMSPLWFDIDDAIDLFRRHATMERRLKEDEHVKKKCVEGSSCIGLQEDGSLDV